MFYPAFATLAFALLLAGFSRRKVNPRLHAALISASVVIDLALVLTLELKRNAVATALSPGLTALQKVHVGASTAAVMFYLPVLVLGAIRLFRPSPANLGLKTWHRRLGYAALFFRTVSFLFIYAMLGR
jgi:hypothetical protein